MEEESLEQKIRIGTSGWSYPTGPGRWTGIFYPPKVKEELSYYSQIFDAVEVNSTFYRPVHPKVAESWARKTPEGFEFTVKLWQKFTHPAMHREATGREEPITKDDVLLVKRPLDVLAESEKLGCLLIQFPPSFKREEGSLEWMEEMLDIFKNYPLAVELRHRSWSDDPGTKVLLESHGVAWVQIDEPKFHFSIRQDYEPRGELYYLRLHGRNVQSWWKRDARDERYDYLYSMEELEPFAEKLKEIAPRVNKAYVFFNNHPRGKAPANAMMLKHRLGMEIRGTYPRDLVEEFPGLKEFIIK